MARITHVVAHSDSLWQIVNAAVLNGKVFKDPAVAHLAAAGPVGWQDCQKLCAASTLCKSFDHVGASIGEHIDAKGLREGPSRQNIRPRFVPGSPHVLFIVRAGPSRVQTGPLFRAGVTIL